MNQLTNLYDALPLDYSIQPFLNYSPFNSLFIVLSGALLIVIALQLFIYRINIISFFFPFFVSEQATLGIYKLTDKWVSLLVSFTLFIVLQLSFLFYHFSFISKTITYFTKNEYLLFGVIVLIILLFLTIKYLLYTTLPFLLPQKVNVKYYRYNYITMAFYVSLGIWGANLFSITNTYLHSLYYEIVFVISILFFYIWFLIRYFSISLRYNTLLSIYFFLYLCTLEIIPLFILIKSYQMQ